MLLFGCTYMLLLLYPATNPADTFMKCNCILNTTSQKICFVILGSQKKMKYFFTGGNSKTLVYLTDTWKKIMILQKLNKFTE